LFLFLPLRNTKVITKVLKGQKQLLQYAGAKLIQIYSTKPDFRNSIICNRVCLYLQKH